MTEQPRHRPVDSELIERYVLDRASEEERIEVESLILADAQWAEALRREQLLAAGARRLGRERLRGRLGERATGNLPPRIPWMRVAAVAASVVIVVGLALYRFLPTQQTASESVTATRESSDVVANEAPPVPSPDREAKEAHPTAPSELSLPKRAEKGRLTTAYPPPAHARPEPGQTGIQELKAAAPVASEAPAVFWTEGTVLAEISEAERLRDAGEGKPKDEFLRNQQRVAREEVAGKSATMGREAVRGGVSLSQRQFSEADRRSQLRARGLSPAAVPTLVRIAGDSLQLTLFLDPPVDDSLLKAARIEPAGPDSFVVTIGSRQLGYRIPLQQQSARQR